MRFGKYHNNGFTLIELMIVVAIVSVLAVIGYPTYSEHVRKTNRKAAVGKVLEIAGRLEQFRTQRFVYPSAAADLADFGHNDNHYTFSVASVAANGEVVGYTITVTPVAGASQASDQCGTLTYNNEGTWTFSTGLDESRCL
ncbi:MAG: type IV pilin protein [Ketobacter sp.]|nr:type IV pilin protein [Ketobacter sp.]